jgi:hypothetical protein
MTPVSRGLHLQNASGSLSAENEYGESQHVCAGAGDDICRYSFTNRKSTNRVFSVP